MKVKSLKQTLKKSFAISTVVYFCRECTVNLQGKRNGGCEPVVHASPDAPCRMRVAVICDEMTWRNCASFFSEIYFLTPWNWKKTLETYHPQLFFCESAWKGIAEYRCVWRGRIFRNHRVPFEHRKSLLSILNHCKAAGIPTVFWNKEDPIYFGDALCDFADTAMHFDHVFTTAEECVDAYRARGFKNVHVMPFGFSPRMFHPLGRDPQARGAVLTGSWFPEHTQRCSDIRRVFEWLKRQQIPLTIYDRQMREGGRSSFPAEYQYAVHPALPYEQMGALYRGYAVGVNINTVKNSRSMFARRVYEMMACGLPVVSNASSGLKKRFGNRIAFCEDTNSTVASFQTAHALLREVFLHDTFDMRMYRMLETVGFSNAQSVPAIDVICIGGAARAVYEKIDWPAKRMIAVTDRGELENAVEAATGSYMIILNDQSSCPDVRFWMTQYAFLPQGCGVCTSSVSYVMLDAETLEDVIWPAETLREQLRNGTMGRVYHA